MEGNYLGIVQNGEFKLVYPKISDSHIKLTEDSMNVGRTIIELKLVEYEGKAILVNGDNRGDWIYQAKIIEHAGPILTIITKKLFNIVNK